ncbi:MAG: LysR family transcriptional regulator [Lawsonibacter sp.]
MDISQLRYFATVAQLENMSRAAKLLHLSQPSLSKNIAKLEAELGMPLFDRRGKKIALNAQGARFLECSNMILRELELAMDDMNLRATGSDFKIKIGIAGTSAQMVACMAAFRQQQPGVEFELNCNIEYQDHIDINDFDVMVYPTGIKYEKFTGYFLHDERYYLAVGSEHPLAHNVSILPKDLDGQNFVFLRSGKSYMEYPFRICTALAVHFGSQCHVDARELHQQMIGAGIAIGFVPEDAAALYQNDRSIRLIPIQDQRFSRTMMICFRREKHLSALAKSFRDFAIEFFHLNV